MHSRALDDSESVVPVSQPGLIPPSPNDTHHRTQVFVTYLMTQNSRRRRKSRRALQPSRTAFLPLRACARGFRASRRRRRTGVSARRAPQPQQRRVPARAVTGAARSGARAAFYAPKAAFRGAGSANALRGRACGASLWRPPARRCVSKGRLSARDGEKLGGVRERAPRGARGESIPPRPMARITTSFNMRARNPEAPVKDVDGGRGGLCCFNCFLVRRRCLHAGVVDWMMGFIVL